MINLDWLNMGGYTSLSESDYRERRWAYYQRVDRDGFCWISSDGVPSGYVGHIHVRVHRDISGIEIVSLQSDGRRRDSMMISAARWIERCGSGCHIIGGHVHRTNFTAAALYRRLGFSFHPSRDRHRQVIRMPMLDFLSHPIIKRMCERAILRMRQHGDAHSDTAILESNHLAVR